MRRLTALLMAFAALFALSPCMAAPVGVAPHTMAGMPAMPCHDDRGTDQGAHACLGCAVRPEAATPVVVPLRITRALPALPSAAALLDHATGFDPPPPRAAV